MDLAKAKFYYQELGYVYTNVPTLVESVVINSTCPPGGDFRSGSDLYHVASGEQGFVQMIKDYHDCYDRDLKEILSKPLQTITACHRPSDRHKGDLYQEWFLKLELYNPDPKEYIKLLQDARSCYAVYFGVQLTEITIEPTPLGLDLMYKGVEIGSYGKREVSFLHPALGSSSFSFSYGTGFVPYRLEKVKSMI